METRMKWRVYTSGSLTGHDSNRNLLGRAWQGHKKSPSALCYLPRFD